MRAQYHLWREHARDGRGSDEARGLDVLDDLHEVGEGRVLVGEGLLRLADAALGPVPDRPRYSTVQCNNTVQYST